MRTTSLNDLLWPCPHGLREGPAFPAPRRLTLRSDDGLPAGARIEGLREDLRRVRSPILAGTDAWAIEVRHDPSLRESEAYALSIGPDGARLRGSDGPGLFYGGQTLLQCLHRLSGRPS